MDHSTSVLGVASSIAHELGHSLGLDHDLPGNSCPCPGPAPAKSCIMEASTDFLPGLNFSNCSRQALEKALLDGMGSCLFERLPSLPSMATVCGNMFVEPGEQCDCGFPDDCTDPCCDYFTCQLRPGAQCASNGLCCQNCQLRPAGWQCRPARGDCDLPEFCPGDSSHCPPDVSLGDGEPCAGGQAVCTRALCFLRPAVPGSGDQEPSPLHHFASLLPILEGMHLGAVGAALTAATCPVPLKMPCVDSSSARGSGPASAGLSPGSALGGARSQRDPAKAELQLGPPGPG